MAIQFIIGKPGTGKTTWVLEDIFKNIDAGTPLYYLVPEQFSLQSEKLLLQNTPAQTKVEVLSFNRLAHRLFASFGGPPGQHLDDLGRQLVLRKVVLESMEDLTFYKSSTNKQGFLDSLAHTITEMNHYRISPQDLTLRADLGGILSAKMGDLATILAKYRAYVTGKYILADDVLELLCDKLAETAGVDIPLLDGACFWIDGFSGFTPQELLVIKHLSTRANKINITLTLDSQVKSFSPPRITMEKINRLNIETLPPITLEKNHRHINSPALTHFVENFRFQKNNPQNQQPTEDIQIISTLDRYQAVYAAASQVQQLMATGHYQFKDIAILCADRGSYARVLETTFEGLNIPLFIDAEISIYHHPLTELIRSSLDIITKNWGYEPIFRFLKTGITPIPADDIDILENFVLENGITSYRWQYPFKKPELEAIRQNFLALFGDFATYRASSKKNVKTHATNIFNLLYSLNIPQTIQNLHDHSMRQGNHNMANIHKQIWPKICQVFDKLVELLGEEVVGLKDFQKLLDAGLGQVSLGRVPPSTNQVVVGDIGRSRYPQIKAMIVLGANDNIMPPIPKASGLFTDRERQLFKNQGLEIGMENILRMGEGYYSLYLALSQPKEKMIIIYPQSDTKGKAMRPSILVTRLVEMFPHIPIHQSPKIQEYTNPVDAERTVENLSQDTVDNLYADTLTTAASRLESFSRCPFQYFLTYVLKAKARKRFNVLPTDLGSLFHDILAQFSKKVWEQGSGALSKTDIAHYVEDIMSVITQESELYNDSARNRHVLSKVQRASTASIWALTEHLSRGAFTPVITEENVKNQQPIPLAGNKNLVLTGIVDRVDAMTDGEGNEYLKIIDYKSGNTKFNMDDVRQGVQLQLMIYMNILTNIRDAKPGGVFYFPVSDPLVATDVTLDEDTLETSRLKLFKMSGVTLDQEDIVTAMDNTLGPGAESLVVPLGINKNGSYKKTGTKIISPDDFTALSAEVAQKITEIGNKIISGEIQPKPYTTGPKSPCNFCEFGAICGKKG